MTGYFFLVDLSTTVTAAIAADVARRTVSTVFGFMVSPWKGESVPPGLMRVWGSVLVAEVVDKDHDCGQQIDGRKNGRQHGDILS